MINPICHHCQSELSESFIQEAVDDLEPDWKEAGFRIQRNCEKCQKILEFQVTSGMYFLVTKTGLINIGAK
ncbi:hypothetical protein [Acinetobacter beijerinckii]|uniref:hypothetical protein n=1 Tax=Acinetobacter beijerinckii TaxID=262668 RepID=UPI0030D92427